MNVFDLIRRHERYRQFAYKDTAGKVTIGFGRNLDDHGVTKEEALIFLTSDVAVIRRRLSTAYPWFKDLSDARKAAIIDMVYNLGVQGFSEFKILILALSRREYETAASAMLASKWAGQVGRRALELSDMIRTDAYPA